MAIAEKSIQHIRNLLNIAEDLKLEGIALYEHAYHPLSFGSFSVEFGKPHDRVLCQWDGKESILSLSFSEITNQTAPREWTHDADISLPRGEGLYQEIASNVLTMIGT